MKVVRQSKAENIRKGRVGVETDFEESNGKAKNCIKRKKSDNAEEYCPICCKGVLE